jgi:hypothetical protein
MRFSDQTKISGAAYHQPTKIRLADLKTAGSQSQRICTDIAISWVLVIMKQEVAMEL